MRYLTLLLLLLLLLLPSNSLAQPASQPATPKSQALVHAGHKGMWFPMPTARQLLKDVKTLATVQATLAKTEQRLQLQKERTELLNKQVGTSEQIAKLWKEGAEYQAKVAARQDSFWRSPYLWVTVGVVVGVATTVGITAIVKKSSE